MYYAELDSFVHKFKHLWHSGENAHLDVHTHAGQAWVSLHAHLGQAPNPSHQQVHPSHGRKDSPSRQRRRARRTEERKKKAEEAKATENVDAETAEEAPNKATENVDTETAKAVLSIAIATLLSRNDEFEDLEKEQEVQVLSDELCPDDIYHQAESESIEKKAFRCLECRMWFLPTSHIDGNVILDFNSCQSHIGVKKCQACKTVLVGLAKIRCHRQVCQHSA